MAQEVPMPQLSQSVVEGEITRWVVAEGDRVELDQVLAEIVTDKVDVELPSPVAGTVLKILVAEGETVPIGTPLLIVGEPGESVEHGVTRASAVYSSLSASIMEVDEHEVSPPPEEPVASATPERHGPVRAAPRVRKLARELEVDLEQLSGSGPRGRITEDDVRAASQVGAAAAQVPSSAATPSEEIEYLPYTGRRRQIGAHLLQAKQTIPHASTMEDVDVTELVALRASQKEEAERQGVRLTYLAYFARATVDTLTAHPHFNASLEEESSRIAVKRFYNLGIAVDTEEGLVVPVLRGADGLDVIGTARGIQELAARAREGRLAPADVEGSTFTISSVGGDAVLFSVGVINAPEVALLNLHRIERRPVAVGEDIALRSRMYVTLTIDHRVLDGGHATRFLRDWKERIEGVHEWGNI
jgi:pyruvate dehydrogenase E2 component (dihydrolipoamide acetyltransferase)